MTYPKGHLEWILDPLENDDIVNQKPRRLFYGLKNLMVIDDGNADQESVRFFHSGNSSRAGSGNQKLATNPIA
jgi:hypothetical protein